MLKHGDEERGRSPHDVRGTGSRRLVAVVGVAVCAFAAGAIAGQDDPPVTSFHGLVPRVTPQALAGAGERCPEDEAENLPHNAPDRTACSNRGVTGEAGIAPPPRWSGGWAR